jgi:F-type H+-transporting ATPase subunit a
LVYLITVDLFTPVLAEFNPLAPVTEETLFHFPAGRWSFTVSNHMFVIALAFLLLLIVIPIIVRFRKMVPTGPYNLIEAICVFLREDLARPILGEFTDKFISFVWTLFFFVLTLNLLGMVPLEKIISLITGKSNYFGGAATANIWITGALAVVTFFTTIIAGIKTKGFIPYLVGLAPPVPWWILPFIYILELITLLIRPLTLAIRLFANIMAGHMLIGTFIGLILIFKNYYVAAASISTAAVLSLMDLLVAFIQAYIFTFLSTLYIGFSVRTEH